MQSFIFYVQKNEFFLSLYWMNNDDKPHITKKQLWISLCFCCNQIHTTKSSQSHRDIFNWLSSRESWRWCSNTVSIVYLHKKYVYVSGWGFLIELCKLRAANALELRLKRVHRSLILKNDIFLYERSKKGLNIYMPKDFIGYISKHGWMEMCYNNNATMTT